MPVTRVNIGQYRRSAEHSAGGQTAVASHRLWEKSISCNNESIELGVLILHCAYQAEGDEDCCSEILKSDENGRPAETNLQEELQMFRARWMSELAPGVGSETEVQSRKGTARGPFGKAQDTKARHEWAKEEKAKELFLKAAEKEQNGALYEGMYPIYFLSFSSQKFFIKYNVSRYFDKNLKITVPSFAL
ncbi:unnamed protein product [Ranitomeya imitator]|uniref:Uncharacterized protein n=1 Tax=Ranitomeya imitator TaxID=111125 RepID=A0ABN9L5W6_9NEOB|nr:unnamed protein product [Ranitomeya imitator]